MNTDIAFTPVTMLIVLIFLVTSVAMAAFFIFLWWRIFSKVGYSGALGLLCIRMVEAMYRSNREGKVVRLTIDN